NWLTWIPAARATSEALAPGSSAAATIRSFSARDQRRRRCTDVITSTALLIGVVLVIVLGLARKAQLRKAPITGGVPIMPRRRVWSRLLKKLPRVPGYNRARESDRQQQDRNLVLRRG